MKVLEKINLIENIAVELQKRFTYTTIDAFLSEFSVNPAFNPDYNSKRIYVQDRLKGVKLSEIKKIADELNIETEQLILEPPKNWTKPNSVKAFISHISKDKKVAKRLRDVLLSYNIECFVAHEDIKPSEEWLEEIKRALNTMDFFISIHTKGFQQSLWCQQEVGYAVARNTLIVPVKFGEDPMGFIGKYQALIRGQKKAEDIAVDILNIIESSTKTRDLYYEKIKPPITLNDIPF